MAPKNDATPLQTFIPKLLKPFVRFCIKRGLRFQEMLEALKVACFEVAKEELEALGHEWNASRLSVFSGLQRKEVNRIQKNTLVPLGSASLLSRIIGQWQSNPEFCSSSGSPRLLDYEGVQSEFADLVKSVSADVNPYTVLFGLEQSGAVKKTGQKLELIERVYDASGNVLDGLEILAHDSNILHKAVSENIFDPPEIPHLHITTVYDNVCIDHIEEIREWLLDRGTTFHEEARQFVAKFDKDANPRLYHKQGGARVSLCAFSLIESESKSHE